MEYYLAIDIGASSGRAILSHIEDKRVVLEEIHRFKNGLVRKNGFLVWDHDGLFNEIIVAMKKCKKLNKIPKSMAIDTWAVDFALLDEGDNIIGDTVGYRDHRTDGMDIELAEYISEDDLYSRTGIQKQLFNTIYQLLAIKLNYPKQLEKAESLLLIPDYFNFLLTGIKASEYTNSTTTQLLNPKNNDWDYELIERLGFPRGIFKEIRMPGTYLGNLKSDIKDMVGYDCQVILAASHDTASAVMAVPAEGEDVMYISSGTWSLMGVELDEANLTNEAKEANLTNEGGYELRYRFLKNIMGMWMINSARSELAPLMDFADICKEASKEAIESIVDANDDRFLAPESMVAEIQAACLETGQEVPTNMAQVAAVIYNSLAKCYARTKKEIERITNRSYSLLHIVGGGANAEYLNQLTARACNCEVLAGPIEATAIGNISAQLIADNVFSDLQEARMCILESFDLQRFLP